MASYNFNKDLVIGNRGENIILSCLEQMGAKLVSKNNDKKHDLVISHNGNLITYECKTDLFPNTGNYFIETKCRGKLSGINVTKADWFATYFVRDSEIWFIKVNNLKSILRNNEHKKVYYAGDKNSQTEAILLKKKLYRDKFIITSVSPMVSDSILSLQPALNKF